MADKAEMNVEKEVNKPEENVTPSTSKDVLMPGCKSLEQFTQGGFASLMNAIKTSNSLPSGSDWDYYSSFPEFQKTADLRGKQVLKQISMVLQHLGVKGNILRRDLEEKFDLLLDANDMILERVNSTLDELAGIKKNPQPVLVEVSSSSPKQVSGSWNRNVALDAQKRASSSPQGLRLITAKNIQRPQIKFKDKIDNRALPFEPKLKDKPNSLKPLAIYLETNAEGEESFNHPYQYELELFTPKEHHLKAKEPIKYRPLAETPLVMVEEPEQLNSMIEELRSQAEIAVDIENHSYRSYQGFACLIQISTREKDYIVDALSLRHCLHELNEVFTKSSIVKVFHGADHDVEWLQRDFGVYLVNMFDTHQAARLLHFAHLSLSFLLKHYCDITVDKRFQLADWRIRPLPQEMINYAREDTHYLLYIYDKMRSDLIKAANGQTNILRSVIQRSTELCLKRYEKPIFSDDMHLSLLQRTKKLFNNKQLYAMKELTAWRDKIAREEDESIGYVLPNHMLMQIAEILPREMQGILACCNPIPPLVRQHLNTLHQMILRAREQPMVKVVTQEEVDSARAAATSRSSGLDPLTSPLLCPHDLSRSGDFRDDLSTLIGDSSNKETNATINKLNGMPFDITKVDESPKMVLKRSANVSVFGYEAFQEEEDSKAAVIKKLKNLSFTSPFQRYKLVKPFMDYLESSEQTAPPEKVQESAKEVTDEERINRIREYFLEMSKVAPPPSQSQENGTANESTPSKKEKETILSKQIPRKRKQNKNKGNSEDAGEPTAVVVSDDESPEKIPRLIPIKEEDLRSNNAKESSSKRKEPISNNSEVESQKKVRTESNKEESASKFDYSKVDYSRFQGGSSSSDGVPRKPYGKEKFVSKVKSKFKWKGRNQSMTYKNQQR